MKEIKRPEVVIFEKLTEFYLLCMFSVYLLFPGLKGYAQLTSHKWILLAILSGGYLAVSLLLRLELAVLGHMAPRSPVRAWRELGLPQKLILLFWCCAGISTALSVDPVQALWGSGRLEGFLTISLYCSSFLLVSRWGRAKPWMLWVFGAAMSINCVVALLQLAGGNPLSLYPTGMTYYDTDVQYEGQFLGTVGNTNLLSALLCIAIPAFLTALVILRDKRRFLLLIPLTLCLTVLLKAPVAGGCVGLLGCALLMPPVLAKEKTLKKRLALLSAACILAGVLVVYCFGGRFGGTVYETHQLLHGRWDGSYGSGRLFIWQAVLRLLPERLLIGGGPDTLGLRAGAYFEHYDAALNMMIRSRIDTAHNEYLNVLINQGLPALALYLAALGSAAKNWVERAADCPATAICGCGVLGYCIQAFFGISSPISTPFLWLAFGLLVSGFNNKSKEGAVRR